MSYIKQSSNTVDLTRRYSYYLLGRTPVSQSGVRSAGSRATTEYRAGSAVADWRGRIRRHQNAAGGMFASYQKYTGGYGQHTANFYALSNGKYVPLFESETGRVIWVPYPTAATYTSSADKEAQMRLLKSAASKMTAFRSLTTLGEMRETLRMLRRPGKDLFRRIGEHIRKVTKPASMIRNTKKRRSYIRSSYLEATFGWQPLVGEIKSAGDALNRRLERYQGSYARVSGKGRNTVHTYVPQVSYNQGGLTVQRRWGVNNVVSYSKLYRGEVKSVCPNPIQADMRLFGATWADVALTGWELVPWSFVADYFTNIGDILEAWSVRDSDWAWLFATEKYYARNTSANIILEDNDIITWPRYRAEKGYTRTFSCSPARATLTTINRSTPLSPPTPSFRWEVPGMGSRKWLNIAALSAAHKRGMKHVSRY